jgi:exosortase
MVKLGLIAGAAAALAILYGGVMTGLAREWTSSPDASYGLILFIVALAISWHRRAQLAQAADRNAPAFAGACLLVIGLCAYLIGIFGADIFLTRISFVAVLTGALWLLAGSRAARLMAAPLVFLLMAVPLPSLLVNAVTLPLQFVASHIAEWTLTLASVPVFRDGNLLTLPSATLEVAEACSGLRSIVSLAAIGALLAWAIERSAWRRAAIVMLTLPIAIVMNGLRIAATGIACETWGPHMASGGWHTFTGWVTFVISTFVLVQLGNAIARFDSQPSLSPRAVTV